MKNLGTANHKDHKENAHKVHNTANSVRICSAFSVVKKNAVIFLAFSLSFLNSYGADSLKVKTFLWEQERSKTDSLRGVFSTNNRIPSKFELPIFIALSHFPELNSKLIHFEFRNIKTTMACRPRNSTIFKKERHYTIFIDTDADGQGILLDSIPFNAQIGIIAHELCHILDYESKTGNQIIGTGLAYFNKNKRADFEKTIDDLTINKGLGHQLLAWSDFALNKSTASSAYKAYKRKTYLTPEEISEKIKK